MRAQPELTLYQFRGCPYCAKVQRAVRDLDLEVAQRDIHVDEAARRDLVEAMGRGTVPVLHIEGPDGSARWMPESADIVRYLYAEHGEGRRPPWWSNLQPIHGVVALAVLWWLISRWL